MLEYGRNDNREYPVCPATDRSGQGLPAKKKSNGLWIGKFSFSKALLLLVAFY